MADDPNAMIQDWFRQAVHAVEPERAVRHRLSVESTHVTVGDIAISVAGRIWIAAVGKAAVGMARGAVGVFGPRVAGGVVITKDGHVDGNLPDSLSVYEASHPIPDERGVAATRAMLAMVEAAGPDDLVLALISGGGSALLEAPRPPVTLHDMARTTELLLRAGAPIGDLNTVRTPLSLVKGGGLRRAGASTSFSTLLLSDVLGNDPTVIASGPTVPSDSGKDAALDVMARYGLTSRAPESVIRVLTDDRQTRMVTIPADEPVIVVGDNAIAVAEMRRAAEKANFSVNVAWVGAEGEAAVLGRAWFDACEAADTDIDVLIGGGEATVTVRGDGVGGRNTEFALAAAISMEDAGDQGWVIASLATDGQDGPTGVAGAIADGSTIARARAAGVDAHEALRQNDSLRVFEAAGGVVRTGPTGTNVNDIYVAVRRRIRDG